jgi:hypothetical protein
VFLYRGWKSGLVAGPAWTAEGDQIGASFGWSVALAGDVNGDGYSDLLVGANRFDGGQANEGRAFAYRDLRSASSNTAVLESRPAGPGLRFERIYPNPSSARFVIQFLLPMGGPMHLTVHDILGRRVAVLAEGPADAGSHSHAWDGTDARGAAVPAGVYWARLESRGATAARKLVRR